MFEIKNSSAINININSLNRVIANVFQTSEYKQLDIEYNEIRNELEELWEFDNEDYENMEMALDNTTAQIAKLLSKRLIEIENDTSVNATKERHKILQKLKELE